jgi:hypothetical protein
MNPRIGVGGLLPPKTCKQKGSKGLGMKRRRMWGGGELTFKKHSAKCLGVLDTSNEKEGVGFSAKKT